MLRYCIFVFIFLSACMMIFATGVKAGETSSHLFILETSDATIHKELTIKDGVVIHASTASRTSYRYNNYPNENLAHIEIGHRSQSYNSRDGYRHYYSVLPDYVEEMLEIDYVTAGEHYLSGDMIQALLNEGFIEASGTLRDNPLLLDGDLYLSGLIVLEYKDDVLFNRVEIDYIGENIFKMRSMMEPTLEYYDYTSVDEFMAASAQHQERVNSEAYKYNYYVDDEFLGETTEVKFFLMDVDEFFMTLYGLNATDYYERYPDGADSVYHRVNDYLNRGYQVTHHEDLTPEGFDISDNSTDELYEEIVEESVHLEESSQVEEAVVNTEEAEDIDDIDEEAEDEVVNEVPTETSGLSNIDSGGGHVLSYSAESQAIQFAHINGTISHAFVEMREHVDEGAIDLRLSEVYQMHQFFNDVAGIDTAYRLEGNSLELTIRIDYSLFTLQEHFIQQAQEYMPIYMDYRLADVHRQLISAGYNFNVTDSIGESGTITLLNMVESTIEEISFNDGVVTDDEGTIQDIMDVINHFLEAEHIIIDIK